MCLSRSGVRSISGFSRALSTNGATALTSCTSSSSTDETSASGRRQELRSRRSTCCRSWSSRPRGRDRSAARASASLRRSSRACDSSAAAPSNVAEQRAHAARAARSARSLARPSCGRRIRRPAHGLAGVVDDEVEPVARREQVRQNASTLGVWRRSRPKISSRSPHSSKSGSSRVAGRGVAREARGDDQLRARAQQLDPGLVADLHAPAGEQRDAARAGRRSRCACRS